MKLVNRLIVTTLFLVSLSAHSAEPVLDVDTFNGYFSRIGNDGTPASTTGKSLYIKYYPDEWVILLYIPFPYSKTVAEKTVHQAFSEVRATVKSNAFVKGKFGGLEEAAIADVEPYRMENGRALFACGNGGTCATEVVEGNIQIVKQGILGEHIIKYLHVKE